MREFIYPADFLILDMEANLDGPLILVQPFLATSRAVNDVQKDELVMRVENEEIKFNVFNCLKYPIEDPEGMRISRVQEDPHELIVENCQFMDAYKAGLTNKIEEIGEACEVALEIERSPY